MFSKGYSYSFFDKKLKEFLIKKKNGNPSKKKDIDHSKRIKCKIPFDNVTQIDKFFGKICKSACSISGLLGPSITPGKKVGDLIPSKRKIIQTLVKNNIL